MVLLELDPNVVKPGWTPLLIIIALLAVMVFLYFSMRKQMRRIDAPYAEDLRAERAAAVAAKLRSGGDGDTADDAPEKATSEKATAEKSAGGKSTADRAGADSRSEPAGR